MKTLRARRKALKLKQADVSAATGISRSVIGALELYSDKPTPSQAKALSDFYGIKIKALFPDGIRRPAARGRRSEDPAAIPQAAAPRPKAVRSKCWKCGSALYITMTAGSPLFDDEARCYICGAKVKI